MSKFSARIHPYVFPYINYFKILMLEIKISLSFFNFSLNYANSWMANYFNILSNVIYYSNIKIQFGRI